MVRFGLIGWGWRAEFFARAAGALPEHLSLAGVVTRDAERARAVREGYGTAVYGDLPSLLEAEHPAFVVVSVPPAIAAQHLATLAEAKVPALCETPPAADLEGLRAVCELARHGARIQVAEQYPFQPLHAARIALSDAGVIGTPSMASVSFSHGYHAFSVMRRHLRIGGEAAVIRAARLETTSEKGNTRAGPRERAELVANERITATLEWDHALGLYDFEQNQHRSYVRLPHVAVRGASGEISDDRVRLVHGLDEIRTVHLERVVAGQDGDLSGHELMGITGLDGWAWRNRFMGARLADDEIAVAECLVHMAAHVEGADGFYHVADAAQDHYLWLCLQQAAASGETVHSEVQPWVDQLTAR